MYLNNSHNRYKIWQLNCEFYYDIYVKKMKITNSGQCHKSYKEHNIDSRTCVYSLGMMYKVKFNVLVITCIINVIVNRDEKRLHDMNPGSIQRILVLRNNFFLRSRKLFMYLIIHPFILSNFFPWMNYMIHLSRVLYQKMESEIISAVD